MCILNKTRLSESKPRPCVRHCSAEVAESTKKEKGPSSLSAVTPPEHSAVFDQPLNLCDTFLSLFFRASKLHFLLSGLKLLNFSVCLNFDYLFSVL